MLYPRECVYNWAGCDAMTQWQGFSDGRQLSHRCCCRMLKTKPNIRNYPYIVPASEVVSNVMSLNTNGLYAFCKHRKAMLTHHSYTKTSRYSLPLELWRRCPEADDFHFRAYTCRYADKEEETEEDDSYTIQLDVRSFHVVEKGKMTDCAVVTIVALTVLTGTLMTGSKFRFNLTYMHRLDNHWQREKCQQQPRNKRMSCFLVLLSHL